jgi:CYTH domain
MNAGTGTEVELKLRVPNLSSLMAIAVAANGRIEPTAVQDNIFLDTAENDLARIRHVLRVRTERTPALTTATVTMKGASQKSRDGMLTIVPEEEVEFDPKLVERVIWGKTNPLDLLAQEPCTEARTAMVKAARDVVGGRMIRAIGGFQNERTRIHTDFPEGFHAVLELDRVFFPRAQVHHEVEMEVPVGVDPKVAQAALEALFARAGIRGTTSLGKAKRFFLALEGETLEGGLTLHAGPAQPEL